MKIAIKRITKNSHSRHGHFFLLRICPLKVYIGLGGEIGLVYGLYAFSQII